MVEDPTQTFEAAAKNAAEIKVTEEIFGAPALTHTGMTAGVISAALGWIRKHCISFGDFAELIGCVRSPVAIGMPFQCKLPVGLLDLS